MGKICSCFFETNCGMLCDQNSLVSSGSLDAFKVFYGTNLNLLSMEEILVHGYTDQTTRMMH